MAVLSLSVIDLGAFKCFITLEHAKCSSIWNSAGERSGLVRVTGRGFLATHGRVKAFVVGM